ncbi:hypothetical protein [Kitasatospora sp. NPDC002040]|uniref:HAAS signaling domain-containing protein n=1 Tax=Kitasatospora sp. NPDC002040 TaxID=3154661 RepID=UPI003318F45E
MNHRDDHPLVHTYLDTVARLTAALSEPARRDLLADLREHIELALAPAGPAADEGTVRQALAQLGQPEAVADAALAEEGLSRPAPERPYRTAVTLALLVLSWPLALVPAVGGALALIVAAVALVRVWRSARWARQEKRRATLLLLAPILAVPAFAGALSLATHGLTPVGLLAALALGLCLPVAGALRLRSAAV